MDFWRSTMWLGLVGLAALAGCHDVVEPMGKSPLRPPHMSPDSVALDAFFARFPLGDPEANQLVWADVDEMLLPAEIRQRLTRNGFRVGLAGGQVPASLARLLELSDKPAPQGNSLENRVTDLGHEPRVVRRHMELRAGARTEIVASDLQEETSVLLCNSAGVEGETFGTAQPILAVRAFPERDGRVRLKLVPEIHHGESKIRYVGTQGALRIEQGRAKRAFDEMAIEAVLAPGQILIASTLPQRSCTLGHRFFTERTDGRVEQKILVLRLAQTQHDELFNPAEVLPLDALPEKPAATP